jgi:hypothetical protein
MAAWGASQGAAPAPTGGVEPSPATAPPAPTGYQSPFGPNPFAANPGYVGPYGPGSYNPQTFATMETAQKVAQMFGGTVTTTEGNMLGAPGSPFSTNQPQPMVKMPDGRFIDPAEIARVYGRQMIDNPSIGMAQIQSILGGNHGMVDLPGRNGVNAPLAGYTASPEGGFARTLSGPGSTAGMNPSQLAELRSPTGPGPSPGTMTPAPGYTGGTVRRPPRGQYTRAGSFGGLDLSNLLQLFSGLNPTLQAYGGLGGGGGNPTSFNPNGQIGQLLAMILGGGGGGTAAGGDLYTRQRNYPRFQ